MSVAIPEAIKLAISHHREGHLDEAEEIYKLILQVQPEEPDAMAMYGTLLSQKGFHDDGLNLIGRAIRIRPGQADYHANHGLVLFNAGQVDAAVKAYHTALEIAPNVANVHYNLGNALQSRGEFHEAIEEYLKALTLKPVDANTYCNMGSALLKQEKIAEAIAAFEKSIRIRPDYAEAMSNLGTALLRDKKLDEAIGWFEKAAGLRPDIPEIINNFAGAMKDAGRLEEAIAWYRRSLATRPHPVVHSNLIYSLQFSPEYGVGSIAVELRKWNQMFALPLGKDVEEHNNYSVPDRRLKVGYVSPNFYGQAEAHFLLPLLKAHDREKFEIHCFSGVRKADEFTKRHKELADEWHEVSRLDDASLAKRIRETHIDVLVDLTMHMGENRLLAFARRPAPVQVTWLAYPGSTGLTAIDYRLTDSVIDPPNRDESVYSEKSVRLEDSWVCYDPLSEAAARPAEQKGPITFGSLNNPCKINPKTLRIWGQVLKQAPDSKLLMLCVSAKHRVQVERVLGEGGIKSGRVTFVTTCSREEYLRQYDWIDIALDPWPYNGITTTCDALWMGVPVVSQIGPTPAGRAGASALAAAGLAELVADSPDRFVKIAVELARDEARLVKLRSTLREQVCKSALMDGPKFAARVEKAYREMWKKWCEGVEKKFGEK